MANNQQIDWPGLRRKMSLEELRSYKWLCGEIKTAKDIIATLKAWKAIVKPSKTACDKHYLPYCYVCSPLANIDPQLKRTSALLGRLRWRLINLPTVAEALGREPVGASAIPSELQVAETRRAENERLRYNAHPVERVFGFVRFDQTSRIEPQDLSSKIYLLQDWLEKRSAV